MKIAEITLMLIGALVLSAQAAKADVIVDTIAFAEDVQNREPVSTLTPAGVCENGRLGNMDMPVVDSSMNDQVYFWTRLQTNAAGTLRHTWYMNGNGGWHETADVELRYGPSPGYRTWSSKRIVPSLHVGDWKVEVTTSDNPSHVLCTARFRVR